jgi:CHAT domain-containing protein/tetratricopeptide (TPR) repeat protein
MKHFAQRYAIFSLAILLTAPPCPAISAPPDLATQAAEQYEAGQYQQAKKLWQRLADSDRSTLHRASALGNLALTLHHIGEREAADRTVQAALELLKDQPRSRIYAQILDVQGELAFGHGQFQPALEAWQQSEAIYTEIHDSSRQRINQLNQSQALQQLGKVTQAEQILKGLHGSIDQQGNPLLKVKEFQHFVEIAGKIGRIARMEQLPGIESEADRLLANLPPEQKVQEQAAMALTLGTLVRGIAARARERTDTPPEDRCRRYAARGEAKTIAQVALAYYKAGAGENGAIGLTSRLHQLNLGRELGIDDPQLLSSIERALQALPVSRQTVFAQINLAQRLFCQPDGSDQRIAQDLNRAVLQARSILDQRAESYALGRLGALYERQARRLGQRDLFDHGRRLTAEALRIAQVIDAPEMVYQWQWQMGRILKGLGDRTSRQQALDTYYPQALASLQLVRNQLVGSTPDAQFSFRDDIEPVYRDYVDLLLSEPEVDQDALNQAIALMDALQVAELENFFRCTLTHMVRMNQANRIEDPTAAIVYPIVLKDRLEVVVQLPHGAKPLRLSRPMPGAERLISAAAKDFRDDLRSDYSAEASYRRKGKKIYDWLLAGMEPELNQAGIKTLVFVLDGALRNVPMGALWDGRGFVIENYAVAVTPGSQLLGARRIEQKRFHALVGGLTGDQAVTVEGHLFPPLVNVKQEVSDLRSVIPNGAVLEGAAFSEANLAQELEADSFPIVHLATHGVFSNNPQGTFLVMGDGKTINIEQLKGLLRAGKRNRSEALELLMLSACETAVGDRWASLGMAGMALRSGANSTVATLWSVNDRSTGRLVDLFYRNLKGLSGQREMKVQALRQAQLGLLQGEHGRFRHPYYWSPFVLLGNWL